MDHEVIWVVPGDKLLGLNRSGMRQFCFVLNEDDTALNIIDNLRARFLENCFEIHEGKENNHILRFSFDNETFVNDKAYKHIKDDLWLQVTKYHQDPYVGGTSYKFIVYKEVKEVPENVKRLSEKQRKLYDRIRSSYQQIFLNTKIIAMTEDQISDDLYVTETEYKDKDLFKVCYHLTRYDEKGYLKDNKPIEYDKEGLIKEDIIIKEQKQHIDTDTNILTIIEKGQSVKEWLSIPKNRKNLTAITICPLIMFNKGVTNYNKHHRDILIILLND